MLTSVADGVLVHQSPLLENNTVVLEGRDGALLVDPGITGDELVCLAADLAKLGQPVVAGFATHPDWDHALWHADLGQAPRYGTAQCAAELRELLATQDWMARVAEVMPPEIAEDVPLELFGLVTGLPTQTQQIPWDGPTVRVIEHRAHAAGHAALWIEEHRVLAAGDMLSDVLVPMLDLGADRPIDDYLAALELLESVAGMAEVIIPGHGSVGAAGEVRVRLDQDRSYVLALRDGREIVDARIGPSPKPGWEWVKDIHAWQQQSLAERSTAGGAPA